MRYYVSWKTTDYYRKDSLKLVARCPVSGCWPYCISWLWWQFNLSIGCVCVWYIAAKCLNGLSWVFLWKGYHGGQLLCIRWDALTERQIFPEVGFWTPKIFGSGYAPFSHSSSCRAIITLLYVCEVVCYMEVRPGLSGKKMRWHFSEQRWEWLDGRVMLR